MLARMCGLKEMGKEKDAFVVLLSDGTIKRADKTITTYFLTSFKRVEALDAFKNGDMGRWDENNASMEDYDAETYGYITDDHELVIKNWAAFNIALEVSNELKDFVTVKQYAAMHDKSIPMIKVLCREGRINGVVRFGERAWMIPKDAVYPDDNRVTAGGRYKNAKR